MFVHRASAVHLLQGYPGASGGTLRAAAFVAARASSPAPRPAPRRIPGGLQSLLFDGAAKGVTRLAATEAERGFSEGNGYLTGLLVNRSA